MAVFMIILCLLSIVIVGKARYLSNLTASGNNTIERVESTCLRACLDECMNWKKPVLTKDDCIIPCGMYVEESKRMMNEHGGIILVAICNNDTDYAAPETPDIGKPEKVSIRTALTTGNITEIWWRPVMTAVVYTIQVWCKDNGNDTMLFEENTWLTWYAFRIYSDECSSGKARVAASNPAGVGDYSEYTDQTEGGHWAVIGGHELKGTHPIAGVGFV